MKGFRLVGDYLFEYLVITVLLAVSAALVLPFIPVFVGVVGYFQRDINSRRFKDIFTTIGKNWKMLLIYTPFELILLIFSCLNIFYFNTHTEGFNKVILAISWIMLIIGCVYFVHAPVIIIKMKTNFFQLLGDGIIIIAGGWWRSIISLGVIAGIIALAKYFPYAILPLLYAVPLIISKLLTESFYVLKARALKTTVAELKRKENGDDYLDENGEINSSYDTSTQKNKQDDDQTEGSDET